MLTELSRGQFKMSCITPIVRYYQIQSPEDKLAGLKAFATIVPRSTVYNRLEANNNYLRAVQNKNQELIEQGSLMRYQLLPCGKCWACRLKYSAEWASRLMWELPYHDSAYYLTLTYDEEHVPIYESFKYIDSDGQEEIYENDGTWSGTLEPEHMTKFIKRLRKNLKKQGIKYFYCGEYGNEGGKHINEDGQITNSMGYRPHYHMILFGAPLDIKKFYDTHIDPKHKKCHWKSKELDELWGMGFVDVAEVEWSDCAYVARYCMKKINNDNDPREYAKKGKIPEFIRMSRNPGIGVRYYNEHKEHIYETDSVVQKTVKGNTSTFKPPSAFDRRLRNENPELYEQIKESRQACAERSRRLKEEINKGISDLEMLQRETEKIIQKGNMLKRVVDFD